MKERERECDRDRGMGREIERESERPFFVSCVFTSTSAVEKLSFDYVVFFPSNALIQIEISEFRNISLSGR